MAAASLDHRKLVMMVPGAPIKPPTMEGAPARSSQRNDIAGALEGIGAGRGALAVLLDSPDAGVRASAGAYLIKLMPDRVLPILHEIEEGEGGSSAGFNAHWAILRWERESKVHSK